MTSPGEPPINKPESPSEAATQAAAALPSESRTLAPTPGAPASPAPEGVHIPGYEILGELGRGGMGVVYKARHTQLGRVVALKMILSGGHAGEADLARFRTEAEAIARLQHPNIVQIHEVGEHGGLPFFSLEFCGGGSLEKKLAGTPLPPREAAALVETLARAMHAAHKKGVIHRDLKPANVLLAEDGTPKVTDFGLAKKLDEAGQTASGAVMGTPSYMAPEQAGYQPDAQATVIGPACDVYALGAILYECLTGRPPFKAATALDTLMQVVSDEPVPTTQLQSKVPRDLETICLKCLSKHPARRYESAAALADDLGRWRRGEPVWAQPPSLAYLLGKQLRRHRVPVTAAAVVLLAAVIGVAISFLQISAALERETQARGEAQDREQKVKATLAEKEALLSEGARSYCELSDREFRKGNVRDSLNWILRAYEVAPADDPLRQSYRHLLAAQGRSLERLLVHGDKVVAVAFSPDGTRVLTGSDDKTARLWDAATGQPLGEPLCHDNAVGAVAFSPDGKRVLTGSTDKTARLWDATTGQPLGEPLRHDGAVVAVMFSPDGRLMLTGSNIDGAARLWDAATGQPLGEPLRPLRHEGLWTESMVFSPDSRIVLTGGQDGTARIWDAASGKQLHDLPHNGPTTSMAFSPDGRTALTGSFDGAARLWDAATGKRLHLLPHAGTGEPRAEIPFVHVVAFSPDGRRVLTGGADGTARLWDAATGQLLGKPLPHGGQVFAVAFSPDGRAALTGSEDGTARLWWAASGQPLGEPLRHDKPVTTVAFSPDGRSVLTACEDGTARLWDMAASVPLGPPFHHESAVYAVAFSPDGRRVLTGGWGKTARLWDAASGKPLGQPLHHAKPVSQVAFSPDGRSVLTVCQDGAARLWDEASDKPLHVLHPEGHVSQAVFSPDGRRVLTGGGDKTALLWDAATGEPLGQPFRHEESVTAVAFSPDGRSVLTGSTDKTARLWDAATGKPLGEPFRHDEAVTAVAFSPDGERALTGSIDGAARLWDAATGKPLGERFRHDTAVTAVAFSPDGRSALTGSWDGAAPGPVQLWDVATGKLLGEPLRHANRVLAAAFSPDGRSVLTDGWLWEVAAPAPDEPARLRAWVAVRTGKVFDDRGILRQLTRAEWLQRWQEMNANGGDWEPRPDGRRWHLLQAAAAETAGQWFAAAFHLNRLLKNDPDNADLRGRRDKAETQLKR